MSRSVLIVDDDPVQLRMLDATMRRLGYETITADGGEAALQRLDACGDGEPAAMVLDMVMPGFGGLDVLNALRKRQIAVPVIVQTAQGSIEVAVSAMRAGAFDFVVKPASPERLRSAIESAMKVENFQSQSRRDRNSAAGTVSFSDLVSNSPTMERVVTLARKAARSEIPVLIEGESGVGKELVAKAIWGASRRKGKPFVTVNCGAIPENLVESILFGHEKGSFTGATERHVGKFVEADGGTLFLDEIGELPPSAQVKLLRAVQDGEIDPVGARSTAKVDIRLISATHRDLLQLVKDGLFREDLYYRLNVFPVQVPPLRVRRGDVALLVRHFLGQIGHREARSPIKGISTDALSLLEAYDWPGNIRQFENTILRAVVLAEGDMLTVDEFPQIRAQLEGIPAGELLAVRGAEDDAHLIESFSAALKDGWDAIDATGDGSGQGFGTLNVLDAQGEVSSLAEMEREMILLAIQHYGGQMSEVARRLGIGRSTLYRKLKEYGIDPERGGITRQAS